MTEPILVPETDRFVIFPVNPKYQDLWDLYKKHEKANWVAEEIDYEADIDDWNSMSSDEKHFIEMILAFFAGSDGIVLENLVSNFSSEVCISEARAFYAFQGMIENVHSLSYALLLDTYVKDPERKAYLFNAIEKIPVIAKKAEWAMKWMNKDKPFSLRLVAFSIVEGVFFSGAFCSIFWLKDKNKMVKSLGHSNELIARDEGMHVDFAVKLFHHLENKPLFDDVRCMIEEAVDIETDFICESLPCDMIGMNKNLMGEYIKFVANRLLKQLGYESLYGNISCPFDFMDKIGLEGKTNFFEKRVSEYQIGTVKSGKDAYNDSDEDF